MLWNYLLNANKLLKQVTSINKIRNEDKFNQMFIFAGLNYIPVCLITLKNTAC